LGANVFLRKNRLLRVVTERDAFNKFGIVFLLEKFIFFFDKILLTSILGGESIIEALELTQGTRNECVHYLKHNQLVVIAPGGTREALFSRDYKLLWAGKTGFAKVAKEAKVVSNSFWFKE
jgi:hypothetical protein